MPNPIVVSVPNTGSRFLQDRVGINGRVHTTEEWEHLLRVVEGHEIVTPFRSPVANWLSRSRRMREVHLHHVIQWYDHWYKLNALYLIKDMDIIVIEDQSDPRITDWSIVGHDEGRDFKHEFFPSMTYLYDLPIVKDHYNLKEDLERCHIQQHSAGSLRL